MTLKANSVDFSAQFGGGDGAKVVLPHFRALKAAKEGVALESFPFGQLAFVLRVDGEVNSYGFSGVGEPEIDKKGEYLAIEIGVQVGDREDIVSFLASSIINSLEIIDAALRSKGIDYDVEKLREPLNKLCQNYRYQILELR